MKKKSVIFIFGIMLMSGFSSNAMEKGGAKCFTGIRSLNITSDEGDINIKGTADPSLCMNHQFLDSGSTISTSVENGTLIIKNEKKKGGGNCIFNFSIPKELAVEATVGSGNISVINLDFDVYVNLGAGNINVLSKKIPLKAHKLNLKI